MTGERQDDAVSSKVALFEGQVIRRIWLEDRWYFAVTDVIGLLTESAAPRKYWTDMKRRIEDEGFRELAAKCRQLKMEASDGKQRVTDAADTATLLRIVQSVPSPKAEPVKQWLAQVGAERLEEMESPSLAVDRARAYYRAQGYAEEWIDARLRGVVARDELTAEWHERGAQEGREFGILTNHLHRGTFELGVEDHKIVKGLKRRHNLRDNMTPLELTLTTLAELTATEIHQARESQGFPQLQGDVRDAGEIAGQARRSIEAQTGRPVVSSENVRHLTNPYQQAPLPADQDEPPDDLHGDVGSAGAVS